MTATLAVWKFASCDGCQLSILDCEDELLMLTDAIKVAYFPEASRATVAGPYTISLVEGSITTAHDRKRIEDIRVQSDIVVTIGACATAGGIQALKNFRDLDELISSVYPEPSYIETLTTSTAIKDHVQVDYELRGCPINKKQLILLLTALLHKRSPSFPTHSVCEECKRSGASCVMVAHQKPCLGPITQAGCGALCPLYNRGCYGCFGPSENPNILPLLDQFRRMKVDEDSIQRLLRSFNAGAPEFDIDDEKSDRGDIKLVNISGNP